MMKLYHPAVYSQMMQARQELAEAFEREEAQRVAQISAVIDRLQLECWKKGCLENAS